MENYIRSGYGREMDRLVGFAESLTSDGDVICIKTSRQGRKLLSCIQFDGAGTGRLANGLTVRIDLQAPAWLGAMPDLLAVPIQQLAVMTRYRSTLGPVEEDNLAYVLRTTWMQLAGQLRSGLFDPCRRLGRKSRRMARRLQLLVQSTSCNL